MYTNLKIAAVAVLVATVAANDTVWVTNTVYTCPCTSSTIFAHSSSSFPHSSASSAKAFTSTKGLLSTTPVTSTLSLIKPSTTSVLTKSPTTTTSLAAASKCIPLGSDCTNETEDFYCCAGAVCDVGLDTPTCIADDSSSTTDISSAVSTTTVTTVKSATTTSLAAAGACIPLNVSSLRNSWRVDCCFSFPLLYRRMSSRLTTTQGDCTNQTQDFYCCAGAVCDVGLDTPTCIVDDTLTTTQDSSPTSTIVATISTTTTSLAAAGTCIPLNGDCTEPNRKTTTAARAPSAMLDSTPQHALSMTARLISEGDLPPSTLGLDGKLLGSCTLFVYPRWDYFSVRLLALLVLTIPYCTTVKGRIQSDGGNMSIETHKSVTGIRRVYIGRKSSRNEVFAYQMAAALQPCSDVTAYRQPNVHQQGCQDVYPDPRKLLSKR